MAGFGDDTVYVEKFVENPHHIEVQVLGDSHGNAIHLFERECSVQRRHQKVVEETPSPLMTPELRAKMGEQAVMAAKAVDYVGAGTVEFLVDDDLNYYFLEMNTRLQVEHPITEEVTGVDLVKEQIRVAAGLPLSYKQEDLSQKGHAIEVRIYAEDPDNNFMPSPGEIKYLNEPLGLGIRHDGYVYAGYKIPMDYDPMISKMIVWDTNREAAIMRMRRALSQYKLTGIKTNIRFLDRIMECEPFAKGKYNTQFIEENEDFLMDHAPAGKLEEDIVIATAFLHHIDKIGAASNGNSVSEDCETASAWKNYGKRKSVGRF
jgi:acetyl-CoA carboxylase biotin carboxylase subunit